MLILYQNSLYHYNFIYISGMIQSMQMTRLYYSEFSTEGGTLSVGGVGKWLIGRERIWFKRGEGRECSYRERGGSVVEGA